MPAYLRPMAPTAEAAILCGDPARALAIAQALLTRARMSNHHRGLWGYWGHTDKGFELTVHATGIGGPSAAVVVDELAGLGVRRAIRVGTCRAPGAGAPIGTAVSPERARRAGGEPADAIELEPRLTAALQATSAVEPVGEVVSGDRDGEIPPGAVADLQSAGLAGTAQRHGVAVAVGLVVAEGPGGRLEDDPLEAASLRLAAAALAALEASG